MGGLGKSTIVTDLLTYLAATPSHANASDTTAPSVLSQMYPGGIFKFDCGKGQGVGPPHSSSPSRQDLLELQSDLMSTLCGQSEVLLSPEIGSVIIRGILSKMTKRILLVLDDVWWREQIECLFPCTGPISVLVTSRTADIFVDTPFELHSLSSLSFPESLSLLLKFFPPSEFPFSLETLEQIQRISELCGGMPLITQVVGGLLTQTPHDGWPEIEFRLKNHQLSSLSDQLFSVINSSASLLSPDELLLLSALAVFPDKSNIPKNTILILWRSLISQGFASAIALSDLPGLLQRLVYRSLLGFVANPYLPLYFVSIHNIIRSYIADINKFPSQLLHSSLIAGYNEASTAKFLPPDGYIYRWAAYHEAGCQSHVQGLDHPEFFEWIDRRIQRPSAYVLPRLAKDKELLLLQLDTIFRFPHLNWADALKEAWLNSIQHDWAELDLIPSPIDDPILASLVVDEDPNLEAAGLILYSFFSRPFDGEVISVLLAHSYSPSAFVREAALWSLNNLAKSNADITERFRALMDDSDPSVRSLAVEGYCRLAGSSSSVSALLSIDDVQLKTSAWKKLLAPLEEKHRSQLLQKRHHPNAIVRVRLMKAIPFLPSVDPTTIRTCLGILHDQEEELTVRLSAMSCVRRISDFPLTVGSMVVLCRDASQPIRFNALLTLKKIPFKPDGILFSLCLTLLQDSAEGVRREALSLLSKLTLTSQQSLVMLASLSALIGDSDYIWDATKKIILKYPQQAKSLLLQSFVQSLSSSVPLIRRHAVGILSKLEPFNPIFRQLNEMDEQQIYEQDLLMIQTMNPEELEQNARRMMNVKDENWFIRPRP